MRTTPVMAAVLTAAACVSENELRYTSTLQAETNGVVLSDDGLDAYAAMVGTTCTVDVNWGCPVADEDLPTDHEALVDHQGEVTVGVSEQGMHTLRAGRWDEGDDLSIEGLRTARLADRGPVLLGGEPGACWVQQGEVRGEAPDAACGDDARHAVDRSTGTLFVGADGEVWAVAADRSPEVVGTGDRIAWDPAHGHLYAATAGGTALEAVDPRGERVWTVEAKGAIRDLTARGDRGEVLVLVTRDDGLGSLERRDGETGRLLGRSVVPTADGTLVASRNGVRVAVVRDGEVSFFALETDGEVPVIDDTPADCVEFEFVSGQPLFD